MPVNTPCKAYADLWPYREPIEALSGGTPAMRKARERFLPKDPHEEEDPTTYDARLNRTTLFDAFGRTVAKLADFPFAKPLVFSEETPDEFVDRMNEDADRCGTSITEFARQVIDDAIRWGVAPFLVDVPAKPEGEDGEELELSLAEEEELGLGRVYFSRVHPLNIIGWRTEEVAGVVKLSQLRIKDVVEVDNPDDPFCPKEMNIIRVYEPGSVTVWEEREEEKWTEGETTFNDLDEIPLVVAYANKKGILVSQPPLSALAEMNVSHWQNSSDQENFLHAARATILFGSGFQPGELSSIAWGPGLTLTNDNADASMKWIETEGRALEAGGKHLEKIEDRMEASGIELLIKRKQLETATKTNQRNGEAASLLQQIVVSVEEAFERAFKIAAEWENDPALEEAAVYIHKDFSLTDREGHDLEALLKARAAGEISRETYLKEVKRRTIFEDLDVDNEIGLLKKEAEENRKQFLDDMSSPLAPKKEDDDDPEEGDE